MQAHLFLNRRLTSARDLRPWKITLVHTDDRILHPPCYSHRNFCKWDVSDQQGDLLNAVHRPSSVLNRIENRTWIRWSCQLRNAYISWFSLSSENEVFLISLIIFFIRIAHICVTVNKEYVKDDYDGGDTVRLYTLDGKCNISGERIKSARTKAKLTQDQLAARLQVAGLQMGQMAISRIESGKRLVPDFELPIIAEALNVSTDWLLGIEKE